ncbi:MAG: CRISPR-associated endonuclease Cas1 [Chloroflexota bacterium]|nr:MAG: CRISPR-associated endonuclease Cas1 [Chloroflexota bacterium]
MTERLIDLAESAAYLRIRNRQLVIERHQSRDREGASSPAADRHPPEDESIPSETSVPLCEVAALIVAHPQVNCSQPVLAELMQSGGAFIVCDSRSLPVGMMLPLNANVLQSQRLAAQASAPLPLKKQLWKQIVRRKILAQAELLTELRGGDHGLSDLVRTVRSGDPDNREAVAARRYWPVLFDDPNFHRRFDAPDANRLLNYGYAVLRAVMGRAICGAGLHPTLGLHHHHRENPFCLADDLIEPYRPLIDAAVVEHVAAGRGTELDRIGKQTLLEAVLARYSADGEVRTLFDLCARTAVSLVKVLEKQTDRLVYPKNLSEPRP